MTGLILYLALSIIIGIILCLYGKKFFFIFIKLLGILIAAEAVFSAMGFDWRSCLLAAAISVVWVFLVEKIYRIAFFICGALLGILAGSLLICHLPDSAQTNNWIIIAVVALILGICAVKWSDLFIMISTAYNGAYMISVPVMFLLVNRDKLGEPIWSDGSLEAIANLNNYLTTDFSSQNATVLFVICVILAIGGVCYQRRNNLE